MEKSAWRQLEEEGYDMSLIEANLQRTPEERLKQNDAATQLIRGLQSRDVESVVGIGKLLRQLAVNDVQFCLVGGYAESYYGHDAIENALEIVCEISPENLKKLYSTIAPWRACHRHRESAQPLASKDFETSAFTDLFLDTGLGPLNCYRSLKGVGDYEAVVRRSRQISWHSLKLNVISLDALIEAKEAMGRPRDLENAKILRAIRERQGSKIN